MLVTYCENAHQIQKAKNAKLEEVILSCRDLSRFNKSSVDDLNKQIQLANDLNLKVILEWDILMTENKMKVALNSFNSVDLSNVNAIRVQDLGAFEYVFQNTNKPIHIIAEGKNHNVDSLVYYKKYAQDRLERFVLSLELTREKLLEYKKVLDTPIEFLVLGRILLFYTPRNLLSALDLEEYNDEIIALGESEESPHKGFPLVENIHGTFMFHIKHQYLLNHLNEIDFIDYHRVDLRFDGDYELLDEVHSLYINGDMSTFDKSKYKFDTIRGFFKINKTNILFKKLKNQKVQRKDEDYIGEIIDAQKPSHLVLHIKKSKLKAGDNLIFHNPEGKNINIQINQLKTLMGKEIQEASQGDFVQIKYHSQLWVKSQAYK